MTTLSRQPVPARGCASPGCAPCSRYEGTGTGSTSRRYLSANELGSIVSVTNSNGIGLAINKYDEFGIPNLGTYSGRYGYTGQAWIPSAQLWHYKARAYHPGLGRLLQPDPIGYRDSPNLYAYVLNDPINFVDPLGLEAEVPHGDITVTGDRCPSGWSCYEPGDFWDSGFIDPVWEFGGGGGGRGQKQPKPEPKPTSKPEYCSSLGYQISDLVDEGAGGNVQNVGVFTVVAGGAVGLSTWFTGVGAGAGGAIAGAGGAIYAAGTAIFTIGIGIKWVSGQGPAATVGGLASWPTMALGPVSQIAAEKTISNLIGKQIPDPCKS